MLALLALGACSSGSDGAATPQPTATSPSTSVPAPEDPTLTAKPPSSGTTLTGVVGAGEEGCLTLSTGGATWLLVGEVAAVEAGDRVTVRGSPAPDLATRCQQGTPFVVETVEPG